MKTTMKLTVIAIVILTMLMACTPAGTPLSMVGQWNLTEEGFDGQFMKIPVDDCLYDIRDDDTVYEKYTYNGEGHGWEKIYDIKKCDCISMTVVSTYNSKEYENTWKWEISGDKMTWTEEEDGHTMVMKFTKKK